MRGRAAGLAASLIIIYSVLYFLPLSGILAYVVPSLVWGIFFIITVLVAGTQVFRSSFNKAVSLLAASVAVAQIFIMIDAGLFAGYGVNPLSFQPLSIILNATLVICTIIGVETSRAYVIKQVAKKRPVFALGLVSLLYTIAYLPLGGFIYALSFKEMAYSFNFIGGMLIPAFASSLFITFVALLGGPIAAIAYRLPLTAFMWFSPILPDLPWGFNAILGTIPPMLGFMYINYAVSLKDYRRAGIIIRMGTNNRGRARRAEKMDRSSVVGWASIAVGCTVLVFFSAGLLNVFPVVPISGSMSPTINVGDMAIVANTKATDIAVGDIIEYYKDNTPILHRVIDIEEAGGQIYFVVKGDANPTPDPLIRAQQVAGKVVMVIPIVGWAAIFAKEAFQISWAFLVMNLIPSIMIILFISSAFVVYHVYWKKNRGGI